MYLPLACWKGCYRQEWVNASDFRRNPHFVVSGHLSDIPT
jgi:hypothetical protein